MNAAVSSVLTAAFMMKDLSVHPGTVKTSLFTGCAR